MREIKFRAWDGEKMDYDPVCCTDGPEITKLNSNIQSMCEEWHRPKYLALMQYTGLKDKTGKEIYEGDIVVCSYFKMSLGINLGVTEVDAELKGVINFNDLSLCVTNIVSEKWSHYTGYDDGEGSCEITYLHDVYEGSTEAEMSIEVIGNIYENPELLK
jgi:uncharacterized phage protein (TIGR01671 family)